MKPRAGFTLIELTVAVVVLVILAATVTPSIVRQLDRTRIDTAARQLEAVAEAVFAFEADLRDTSGPLGERAEFPFSLTQLVVAVQAAATDTNICGRAYEVDDAAEWIGPYLDRVIPDTGLPTAIGTIQVNFTFVQGGNNDLLYLVVPDVTEEDVLLLNDRVDADRNADGGTVRWIVQNGAQGLVTLNYTLPIGSSC